MPASSRPRSISDEEIALIKAMLARGMPNNKIQLFFNRPDRLVNSGRITGIKDGSYSDSGQIPAASSAEVDAFLEKFSPTSVSATVEIPAASSGHYDSPIDPSLLSSLFEQRANGLWYFKAGESDRHECKEAFGFRHSDRWLRAAGALANNNGGYIFFGVKDKSDDPTDSFRLVGLNTDEFANADPSEFTKRLKSVFDPTPKVETTRIKIGGLDVGVMFVHQHESRPVIVAKGDGQQIREGDILYRYPGQSSRIKYSDLRTLLDERDRQAREQILPMVQKLLERGPRNAMVADLKEGTLGNSERSILIGEDLLERIKFIREGEFDEKEGAETLRLIGDLQAVARDTVVARRGVITPSDVISDFMNQRLQAEPLEYIRVSVQLGNGAWLPIHYFAKSAGLSQKELASFIRELSATPGYKRTFGDRASMVSSAYAKAGGKSLEFLEKLQQGKLPQPNDLTDAANIGRAFAGLDGKPPLDLETQLGLLGRCRGMIEGSAKQSWMSTVRRGLARLDELYFAQA